MRLHPWRALCLPALIALATAAVAQDFPWMRDYDAAIARAREERKPLFVFVAWERRGT